ncbi:DUF192 domain-containing protein [Candidatus Berkelbacteria bacterium]|nr:DUF192 domain-containing protein [Candidatus Berkelbacteria bacterium]
MSSLNFDIKILLLFLAVIVMLAAGFVAFNLVSLHHSTITIAGVPYNVELARTSQEREKGLMGRLTLAPNHGMLFMFDSPEIQQFWNQDTLIPLDVIFIENGEVVDVQSLPKISIGEAPTTIQSSVPAQYALELNQPSHMQVGDPVIMEL